MTSDSSSGGGSARQCTKSKAARIDLACGFTVTSGVVTGALSGFSLRWARGFVVPRLAFQIAG